MDRQIDEVRRASNGLVVIVRTLDAEDPWYDLADVEVLYATERSFVSRTVPLDWAVDMAAERFCAILPGAAAQVANA